MKVLLLIRRIRRQWPMAQNQPQHLRRFRWMSRLASNGYIRISDSQGVA
jgi:hypothetical protein